MSQQLKSRSVFYGFWQALHSNQVLIGLLLIIILCVASAVLYRPMFVSEAIQSVTQQKPVTSPASQFQASQVMTQTYYFSWPVKEKNDIYRLKISAAGTSEELENLTNSTNYAEFWPIVFADGDFDRLAFVAISDSGERSLRVLKAGSPINDATYNVNTSELGTTYLLNLDVSPQWSPDGKWIAFLGQTINERTQVSELFVTWVDNSSVFRLTDTDNQVLSFEWLDAETLLYALEKRGALAIYRVNLPPVTQDPQIIATLVP